MKSVLRNLNNLQQRLVAGILGSGVIAYGICFSEWTYYLIFFLICVLSLLEFYKLTAHDGLTPLTYWGTFTGVFFFSLSFYIESGICPPSYYFIIFPIIFLIFFFNLFRRSEKPFNDIAYIFLGLIYIALPITLINYTVFENGEYQFEIILAILLIIWSCDVGAYFAGKGFGKNKLFERISPKKTWEGALGGAILAFLMAFIMVHFFKILPAWKWYGLTAIILVTGTMGDLVESLFKRGIFIKNSGSAIPGHGGFLDRFDALFLSAPFIATFLKLF